MRAKYARRKGSRQERWKITLYWAGKKWTRYRYDDRVPLSSEFLAQRLCHAINSEIERLGPGFSPKSWFAPSSYELRLDNYARAWLERRERDIAPASYTSFRSILEKYLIPALGYYDIRALKRGHLEDYLHRLPTILAPATRSAHLGVIRAVLGDAYRREDIQRIPPFPAVRIPQREIQWLTAEQQAVVLDAIPCQHQSIFRFMVFYGCRPGEARALQWDCVDFDRGIITIRRTFSGESLREATKSGAIRQLPLMPEMAELLRPIRGIAGYVFRTERGQPYPHCRLTRLWDAAVEKARIAHIPLYNGIRHSRAMQLLSDSANLEHIKTLLGHTSTRMTRRYARGNLEMLREMLKR